MGLDYKSYDYNGKIAIVVGNERYGINNDWYLNQHKKVYIPMEGRQNSINVSVAACILAYEAYMRRR
jgi:TrmH family RNA methyltransferase